MTQYEPEQHDLEAISSQILRWLESEDFVAAERSCKMMLSCGEKFKNLWFYLGAACHGQHKYKEALDAFKQAAGEDTENVDIWNAIATTLSSLKRYPEALKASQQALWLSPDSAQCLSNVGIAYEQVGQLEQSLDFYQQALQVDPMQTNALINLSAVLVKLRRMHEARNHCLNAIAYLPTVASLYNNLAEAEIHIFDFQAALHTCEQALLIDSKNAAIHLKRGLVLAYLQRFDKAQGAFTHAQVLQPDIVKEYFPDWFQGEEVRQNGEFSMDARLVYLDSGYQQQTLCDWRMRDEFINAIKTYTVSVPTAQRVEPIPPLIFQTFALPVSPQTRLQIAYRISERISGFAWLNGVVWEKRSNSTAKPKIRVGYVSPDFRQHPTAILTRQIYGLHDREKFEIFAYSLHYDKDSLTVDIMQNCDVFRQVQPLSALEIASLIREDDIDILIDMAGYTKHSRTEVFALRPAPVQISYLGFVHSMGADFIDYAMIDQAICPVSDEHDWQEKVIRLPYGFYTYDNQLENRTTSSTRADYGLPEDTIVFCCLNASYKIEPDIFKVWMSILKAVPNSVVWLLALNEDVKTNLQREAEVHGVEKVRLIFAGHMPMIEHLKRYQVADIFLDTYWCNAHTTALDALWQGLPVLTCRGEGASSRVAASLLNALEMPELITTDLEEYEKLAIFYATHNDARHAMHEKLKAKRYTAPLFNTELTVRHIERAYLMAWERHQAGLPPAAIDVPAIELDTTKEMLH